MKFGNNRFSCRFQIWNLGTNIVGTNIFGMNVFGTNEWTNGRTKSHIEVGSPLRNSLAEHNSFPGYELQI